MDMRQKQSSKSWLYNQLKLRLQGSAGASHHTTGVLSEQQRLENIHNAHALETGLLWVVTIPMLIKFLVYTGLYWSYPRDRKPFLTAQTLDGNFHYQGDVESLGKSLGLSTWKGACRHVSVRQQAFLMIPTMLCC